jgi:1-aminocyclopropane-1-carboxylate deaminase
MLSKAKLVQEHWVDWSDPVYDKVGNIQLSRLMGAEPRLDPSEFGIGHKETLANLTKEVIAEGGKPVCLLCFFLPFATPMSEC